MLIRILLILQLLFAVHVAPANDPVRNYSAMVGFLSEYLQIKYHQHQFDEFLYVAVKQRKLYYISQNRVLQVYAVSTAKNGTGGLLGSQKTPTGLHIINEKVGDEVPLGGIIKEKVYSGKICTIEPLPTTTGRDEITTRLFHLAGMEPGINKNDNYDSYNRGIMIHGTPEEGLIGQPVSHGCVRMKNEDIKNLFSLIKPGTLVVILNN